MGNKIRVVTDSNGRTGVFCNGEPVANVISISLSDITARKPPVCSLEISKPELDIVAEEKPSEQVLSYPVLKSVRNWNRQGRGN